MNPEHKTFIPHELKLSETGQIELAFAQLNVVDSDGDVTLPGAFPSGKSVPMSAYGHTSWDGALPTGKGVITEQGDWAVFMGAFLMGTDQGKNTYATVKEMGELQEYSYGYQPVKFSFGERAGKQVRFLEQLDVFEVSPVLRGAGVGTHTLAIKSGAPGSDASYAEQLSWYTEKLPAVLDRIKGHSAARASEGRKLSRSDQAALDDLIEAFQSQLAAAQELRASAEPKALVTEIDILLGEAQTLGVEV